jgi:unsaturated rhamnogalacturonyl hydrolase
LEYPYPEVIDYIDYLITNSTPLTPLWNIENIKLGKKPKWNYIDGCMIKALLDLYDVTKNQKYFDFAESYIDAYVMDDGSLLGYQIEIYDIDSINEGKVLFRLFDATGKEKYRKALDLLYHQIQTHPRTPQGSLWHKKTYPNQVWLDGLYMAQPFYIEYENRFNNHTNYGDIFHQFSQVFKFMKDETTGLYFHGFDESRAMFWAHPKTGLSKHFWLRALGWFAMAMVDVIELTDKKVGSQALPIMIDSFHNLIDSILAYQDAESGMWYQVIDKPEYPGNYLETSGSAIMSYCILKAVRIGLLPLKYQAHGLKAFQGICDRYLQMGPQGLVLGGICLMAGLGGPNNRDGSVEYYLSEPIVENDAKGVGPFLFAYGEVVQIQLKDHQQHI